MRLCTDYCLRNLEGTLCYLLDNQTLQLHPDIFLPSEICDKLVNEYGWGWAAAAAGLGQEPGARGGVHSSLQREVGKRKSSGKSELGSFLLVMLLLEIRICTEFRSESSQRLLLLSAQLLWEAPFSHRYPQSEAVPAVQGAFPISHHWHYRAELGVQSGSRC